VPDLRPDVRSGGAASGSPHPSDGAWTSARASAQSAPPGCRWPTRAARWPAAKSTNLPGGGESRYRLVWQRRPRLPAGCPVYIPRCRYAAWVSRPLRDRAARPAPDRRPLGLPLHSASARQARLRSVPWQPNLLKKQNQENSRSSLPFSFSPCSLIKSTKTVSEMLAQRGGDTGEFHADISRRTACRYEQQV